MQLFMLQGRLIRKRDVVEIRIREMIIGKFPKLYRVIFGE